MAATEDQHAERENNEITVDSDNTDEAMAKKLADLYDEIMSRAESNQFPLVKPGELETSEQKEAADITLGLIEKEEHVRIESFLQHQKELYFESHRGDVSKPQSLQVAEWSYRYHYSNLRLFLISESLRMRKVHHRFQNDVFLPLIPPQSIQDADRKAFAIEIVKKFEPTHINDFEERFWKGWDDIAQVLEYEDVDYEKEFRHYVESDYFRLMEMISTHRKTITFVPLYEPKDADEKALIAKLIPSDNEACELVLSKRWEEYRDQFNAQQQMRLSKDPPIKFKANHYFSSMFSVYTERIKNEKDASTKTHNVGRVDQGAAASTQRPIVGDIPQDLPAEIDFDELINPIKTSPESNASQSMEYMTAAQLMTCGNGGGRCKYQGWLIACDNAPRQANQTTEESPKKKVNTGEPKNTAADCLMLDKTGVISFVCFGRLAVDLCKIWNNSTTNNNVRCIIDINKAKIYNVPSNNWNGRILTNMVALKGIPAQGLETGTEFTVLNHATAPSLMTATYEVPTGELCISNFQAMRSNFKAPFRGTFKGVIEDVGDLEYSLSSQEKKSFVLIDSTGSYIKCCAQYHSVHSPGLREKQEAILYYAIGRGKIGTDPGMLYLQKDSFIMPIGRPRASCSFRTHSVDIEGSV